MTIRLRGNLWPETCMAEMIRSWLSRTATSGNPTRKNWMPFVQLTSIVMIVADMPCNAKLLPA